MGITRNGDSNKLTKMGPVQQIRRIVVEKMVVLWNLLG